MGRVVEGRGYRERSREVKRSREGEVVQGFAEGRSQKKDERVGTRR